MSGQKRARVEVHPDPGHLPRFDVTPVDDREWPGGRGTELKPCQDVGPVDPAVNHLDMPGQSKHATKPRERLLGTLVDPSEPSKATCS